MDDSCRSCRYFDPSSIWCFLHGETTYVDKWCSNFALRRKKKAPSKHKTRNLAEEYWKKRETKP